METTEIVAKLTSAGMQNSYLMTYMGSVRETLAQSGLTLTREVTQALVALNPTDGSTPDPATLPHYEEAIRIHQMMQTSDFQARVKQIYKAKMLEVLEQLDIELTPEAIAAFQTAVTQHPEHFASLFASVL